MKQYTPEILLVYPYTLVLRDLYLFYPESKRVTRRPISLEKSKRVLLHRKYFTGRVEIQFDLLHWWMNTENFVASPVCSSKEGPNTRDYTVAGIVYVNIICGEPLNIHVLIPDLQRLQVELKRTRTLETAKCSLGLPSFVDASLKCISAVQWLFCRERNGEECIIQV